MPKTNVTITAQNTWSDPISIIGAFNISISGTFTATVSVQRRENSGASWRDVKTYTAAAEEVGDDPMPMQYRVGVATGAFTSGTITASLNGRETARGR